jgi:hypothetical protein
MPLLPSLRSENCSNLSQDVIYEIIHWLPSYDRSDDHYPLTAHEPSSCACALVCRSWLAPARSNIFRRVDVKLQEDIEGPAFRHLQMLVRYFSASSDKSSRLGHGLATYIQEINWHCFAMIHLDAKSDLGDPFGALIQSLVKPTQKQHLIHRFRVYLTRDCVAQHLDLLLWAPDLAPYIHSATWNLLTGYADTEAILAEEYTL